MEGDFLTRHARWPGAGLTYFLKGGMEEVEEVVEFFAGDDEGGHEVKDGSEGAEEDPAVEEGFTDTVGEGFGFGLKTDDADEAKRVDMLHMGMGAKGKEGFAELGGALADTGKEGGVLVVVEGGVGGGAGDGVAAEGVAVLEGVVVVAVGEGVVKAVAGDGGAERKGACGEGLAEADDVGIDMGMLEGEETPGATKAGGDFIDDEEDVVFAAPVGDAGEGPGSIEVHAGGTLDEGFNDEGGEFVSDGAEAFEKAVEAGLGAGGVVEAGGGTVGKGKALGFEEEVGEGAMEGFEVAKGHAAEGVAVVGGGEAGKAGAGGLAEVGAVLDGDFDGLFDGAGPVGGEEDVAVGGGHEAGEAFGEADGLGVGEVAEDAVLELGGLLLDSMDDVRVAMAKGAGPPGGDGVDEGSALVVVEIDAVGGDDDGEAVGVKGGEAGVGMPEVVKVAFEPRRGHGWVLAKDGCLGEANSGRLV